MSECEDKDSWTLIKALGAIISMLLLIFVKAIIIVCIYKIAYKNYQLNGIGIFTAIAVMAMIAILKRETVRTFCHSKCYFNAILLNAAYVTLIGLLFQFYYWIVNYA